MATTSGSTVRPVSTCRSDASRVRLTAVIPSTTRRPTIWISCTQTSLADSFDKCVRILDLLERNRRYVNLSPKGEPHLGRRGLYDSVGGQSDGKTFQLALLWVLNLSDGSAALLDIAERADLPFDVICAAADALARVGLLEELSG